MISLKCMLTNIAVVAAEIEKIPIISANLSIVENLVCYGSCIENINAKLSVVKDVPVYQGEDTIYPIARQDQTLKTAGYKMNSDIIVKEVPYFETSNQNGTTVYIARE